MPTHVVERAATEAERAFLEQLLSSAPTSAHRFRRGAVNALVLWAVSLLGLVIVWAVSAWIVRKLRGVEFGLHSDVAVWVFAAAIPLTGAYAVVSSIRWVQGWKDQRPLLRADIAAGRVVEEHYDCKEAKRFQEPEHGGLLYFLRTTEDKVLVLFDHESQDLGVQGGDPLKSGFAPMSGLTIVRAPGTGFVISRNFSGDPLDAGEPIVLDAAPQEWPEPDGYCGFAWGELESRLGPRSRVP